LQQVYFSITTSVELAPIRQFYRDRLYSVLKLGVKPNENNSKVVIVEFFAERSKSSKMRPTGDATEMPGIASRPSRRKSVPVRRAAVGTS
jgi:hypothetical protein